MLSPGLKSSPSATSERPSEVFFRKAISLGFGVDQVGGLPANGFDFPVPGGFADSPLVDVVLRPFDEPLLGREREGRDGGVVQVGPLARDGE